MTTRKFTGTRLLSPEELTRPDLSLGLEPQAPVDVPAEAPAEVPAEAPVDESAKFSLGLEELKDPTFELGPLPKRESRPATPVSIDDIKAYFALREGARGKTNENRLIAQMGQIGQTLVENTSGAKGGDFFKNLLAEADAPEKKVDADFTASQLASKIRMEREKASPNSPYSRRMQEALRDSAPRLAKSLGDQLYQLNEAQLNSLVEQRRKDDELRVKEGELAEKARWHGLQDENTDQAFGFKVKQADIDNVLNKYKAVTGRISALKAPQSVMIADLNRQAVNGRQLSSRLDKLGEKTVPFADFTSAFDQIESVAPGLMRGQVPRDFPLSAGQRLLLKDPTGVGARMADPRAQQLNSALSNLTDLMGRLRSGAVLNEGEEKRYKQLIMDGIAAGPQVLAQNLNQIRQGLGLKLRTQQQSFGAPLPGEDVSPLDVWKQMGGLSFEDPVFGDPGDSRSLGATQSPQAPDFSAPNRAALPKGPVANRQAPPAPAAPLAPGVVRVRFKKDYKGPKGIIKAGTTGRMPSAQARAAIESGLAEEVK